MHGSLPFILCCSAFLAMPGTAPSFAQSLTEAVLTVSEAERQVRAALAASNATLEATKRQSDRALRRQLFEIDDLRAEIADLAAGGGAAAQQIEVLRNTLAEEQQRFIDILSERDRVFAAEIASYRLAVEDIASTPEGLAARDLAAARRIAQLALDAWQRAKVTTESVIVRYEEITGLDPTLH